MIKISQRDADNGDLTKEEFLSKYTPEYIQEHADEFEEETWIDLARYNSTLITPELIKKYNNMFSWHVWSFMTGGSGSLYSSGLSGAEDVINKYAKYFNFEAWEYFLQDRYSHLITPDMINDLINENADKLNEKIWSMLINNNLLTPEIVSKHGDKLDAWPWLWVWVAEARDLLTPELVAKHADRFEAEVWKNIAKKDLVTPAMIDKYADLFINSQDTRHNVWGALAGSDQLTPELVAKYVDKFNEDTWTSFAESDQLTSELVAKYMDRFSEKILRVLYKNGKITQQQLIQYTNKPSELIGDKSSKAKISKNKYVLRILEKYMEDNGLDSVRDLGKIPELARFRDNALVKSINKKLQGKPITKEIIQNVMNNLTEYEENSSEYFVGHQEFKSQTQSDEQFKSLTREIMYLGFDEIEGMSEDTKRFIEEEGSKLRHNLHQEIGFGGKNLGWVVWKNITDTMGKPAVLIEQLQSDYRNFFSKFYKMVKKVDDTAANEEEREQAGQASKIWDVFVEKYGIDTMKNIEKELNSLVKDYEPKLLAEFLLKVKGVGVYMTGKDKIVDLIGYKKDDKATMPEIIYEKLPKSFGFTESDELPGYLKLEKARMKYKSIIESRLR